MADWKQTTKLRFLGSFSLDKGRNVVHAKAHEQISELKNSFVAFF